MENEIQCQVWVKKETRGTSFLHSSWPMGKVNTAKQRPQPYARRPPWACRITKLRVPLVSRLNNSFNLVPRSVPSARRFRICFRHQTAYITRSTSCPSSRNSESKRLCWRQQPLERWLMRRITTSIHHCLDSPTMNGCRTLIPCLRRSTSDASSSVPSSPSSSSLRSSLDGQSLVTI